MSRFRSSTLIAAICMASSCAFDDGEPWGRADIEATASLAAREMQTPDGFVVTLDSAALRIEAALLEYAGESSGESDHDHDHDHADEGAAEPADATVVTQLLDDEPLVLTDKAMPVPRLECADQCILPRGQLATAGLLIHSIRLAGTVSDPTGRLPEDVAFDIDVVIEAELEAPIEGTIGRDEPTGVHATLSVEVPATLFDEANLVAAPQTWAAAISSQVQAIQLMADIERTP